MTISDADQNLHHRAVELSQKFKRAEAELLEILGQIDEQKVYLKFGVSSLFRYSVEILGLTEAQSYSFMAVARKCKEVLLMKTEIQKGNLTVSKAPRIVSVVTPENEQVWVPRAASLPKAKLEAAIAEVLPDLPKRELVKQTSENQFRLSVSLSKKTMENLNRVKSLMMSAKHKNLSLEEVIEELAAQYLKQKDPLQKAERSRERNSARQSSPAKNGRKIFRRALPSALKHQIFQRDRGECQFKAANRPECRENKFIEIHHIQPVAAGGRHEVSNLLTLCSAHHSAFHAKQEEKSEGKKMRESVSFKNPLRGFYL